MASVHAADRPTPYVGHPLSQPVVECTGYPDQYVVGPVVRAVWTPDGDFDREAVFYVLDHVSDDVVCVQGWAWDVERVG